MDKHTFIILIKSLIATLIMSIFILFFDLTKQTWMNYSFTDRAVNLSLLIISATIIYFIMLYLFNTKPKNLKQQS